ncbi:amidohydrolase [Sorangium cellulosum]|jgi:predicted TIM-barrel fold metal-dependent hydrolase|uniref:Amidohydrolase n=1 Tax=Sorangium cellulosum TaxID=56 RepID=A0A4P2PXC6_SORCE|nr:amidohydrolase family protein [Sorangium cellulosum]AUX21459.1 amidohydrolase [Sorangium cellulosum]
MIIDAHAHVSPTSYGSAENYLEQLERGGIQQGVVCPGGMLDVRRFNNYITGKNKPDAVPKNDYVVESVEASPALRGLACVDPCDPGAVEVAERYLDRGLRGLMVTPLVHRFSFCDDVMAPLARLCGEREVPIYSHVAFRPGANTSDYVALARRFPKTSFILEHMGAGHVDNEASTAAATLDNLFLETSLSSYLQILLSVQQAGASKVIFGSEYPLSHPAAEIHKVLLLPISGGERDKILGGNIRALLHLESA